MNKRAWWVPVVAAIVVGGIATVVAYHFAGDDINKEGDWRNGAARFVGLIGAIGAGVGFVVTQRVVGVKHVTRDGFMLSYKTPAPTAEGYRDMTTIAVKDLTAKLAAFGYAPRTEACNDLGERSGTIDDSTALQGANVALLDPGVRGWVRVALAPFRGDQPRALGLVEIWSEGGDSADELGLFTLRALDALVDDLSARRDTSSLSADTIPILTAGVGDRPVYRKP